MSNCPKCRLKISPFTLGFLSEKLDVIQCPACKTKLNIETPDFIQAAANASALVAICITVCEFINDNPYAIGLGIVSGGIFMGVSSWMQYKLAHLSITLNQNPTITESKSEFTLKLRPPMSSNPSRVEFLKNVYHDASPERLENIATDEYMIPEARIAARELLQQQ